MYLSLPSNISLSDYVWDDIDRREDVFEQFIRVSLFCHQLGDLEVGPIQLVTLLGSVPAITRNFDKSVAEHQHLVGTFFWILGTVIRWGLEFWMARFCFPLVFNFLIVDKMAAILFGFSMVLTIEKPNFWIACTILYKDTVPAFT